MTWIIFKVFLLNLSIAVFANDYKNKHAKLNKEYVRGCYYTNWAQYRQGKAKFVPENYVAGLCTHIFYAFVTMNETFAIRPFEWNDESADYMKGMFERVNELKKQQPSLKTLLSFGGWTFSQQNERSLKAMSSSQANRKAFILSALDYTKRHKFDGFDLDWEYPAADDKDNLALLLKEMSSVFRSNNLLLTAAVAASIPKIDAGYDVLAFASTLDFINVMTYDLHGSWEKITGFNSPLYDRQNDSFSVVSAVNHWVSKGMPAKKILVGFATYGRAWTLLDPKENGVNSPGSQARAGQFTQEAGFLAYYEICEMLQKGAKNHFDQIQKVPYAVIENQWVGYDDVTSFILKLDWLKQNDFGGAFVWTLDLDDFDGICKASYKRKFPLISVIYRELASRPVKLPAFSIKENSSTTRLPSSISTTTSTRSQLFQPSKSDTSPGSSTSPVTPKSQSIPGSDPKREESSGSSKSTRMPPKPVLFNCPSAGLFPDPSSCAHFYSCHFTIEAHHMTCGSGLMFNSKINTCDWPHNSQCETPTTPSSRYINGTV